MTMHTFKMSETHAEMIFKLVDQHTSALRNWTASAVEDGDFERAQALVKDLRRHQDIYRAFNLSAVREIAARRECPVETQHTVYIA